MDSTAYSTRGPSSGSSQDAESSAVFADGLIKNLRTLTLDPNTKPASLPLDYSSPRQEPDWKHEESGFGAVRRRRGVRTLLTVQQNLKERMLWIRRRYLCQLYLGETQQKETETKRRTKAFQCTCSYCKYNRQLPEESNMENNDAESN
ncbi:developmental pluripotency-associated protein 3 [Suncus etruscus]|uniref:developmental pluripotency-associated protein 3 n=1 Tax=Suncus etruscus TaxID=109475 RepID=UPI0021104F70|nr:developmental pluripotency-associated protein 3 [Suncus etruscus]